MRFQNRLFAPLQMTTLLSLSLFTRQYLFTRIYNARFQRLFLDDSSWLIEHRYNGHHCCSRFTKSLEERGENYLASSDAADYRFSLFLSMRASCGNSLPPSKRSSRVGMDPCAQQDCQWSTTCAYIRVCVCVCARVEADISSRGRKIGRVQLKRVPKRDCSLNGSLTRHFEWYYGIIIVGSISYIFHTNISCYVGKFFDRQRVVWLAREFEFLGEWKPRKVGSKTDRKKSDEAEINKQLIKIRAMIWPKLDETKDSTDFFRPDSKSFPRAKQHGKE